MIDDWTERELGRHLRMKRGLQYVFGAKGDPYALLLRADGEDTAALHRRVREEGRLYRSATGAWVTADPALGAEILADPRLDYPHGAPGPVPVPNQGHPVSDAAWMQRLCHVLPLETAGLNLTRDDYRRLAAAAEPAAGEPAAKEHHDRTRRIVEARLDEHGAADGFDLRADIAVPAAVTALSRLCDLPAGAHGRFAASVPRLAGTLDATLCPPRYREARDLVEALREVRDLVTGLVPERRAAPGDDLLGAVLRAGAADDDAVTVAVLLAAVGVDLAVNLVCDTLAALLASRDAWAALRDDPARAAAAVARHAVPVRMHSLIAQRDLDLAGEAVAADGQVVVLAAPPEPAPSGPTAPDAEPAPRRDDLCTAVAEPWARAFAAAAVETIAARAPGLTAAPPPRRLRAPVTGGVLRFPVRAA
ncbi:hypothetical protein [Actinomadura sp. WMMB 499]|uniref:hypothetical protein n=1 Tax=Actinomadura sp. WMMB 499 TaxID=1219491 RepID=UPI0012444DE4|nr:hypothetical protein [Actinomadura sp. WMMB 499]QFG24800.1 hypothetical protein F7P10_30370 [Actinomadura sp. WMMB 499]